MSLAPLILSFLISNMLDPAASMTSTAGGCRTSDPALYSVQRECDNDEAVGTLHFTQEMHTERLMVHTSRQSTDNLAEGEPFSGV